ncbi:MAG: copper chaperone PCu(A)C [Gemmatimonas sp.]
MRRRDLIAAALLAALAVLPASAQTSADIVVEDAWAPATPGGARTAAIYFTIRNVGTAPDRLVGVTSPAAQHADVHQTMSKGDMMSMHHMDGVDVPAGGSAVFAPNGSHVMLMGLNAPLKAGDKVPVTLKFQNAGEVPVVATVRNR